MFKVKWEHDYEGKVEHFADSGFISDEKGGICRCIPWAMGSCAVMVLEEWNRYHVGSFDALQVDAFFKFLATISRNGWEPEEAYFLLSDTQLSSLNKLISHSEVKYIDKFKNKSHGPNLVHLFRWSKAKDFPCIK